MRPSCINCGKPAKICKVRGGKTYYHKDCSSCQDLRQKYNLTYNDLQQMLKDQDHKCAICAAPFNMDNRRSYHIDHCHTSNRVRGLLCPNCNSGIGKLREDTTIFENALEYLRTR